MRNVLMYSCVCGLVLILEASLSTGQYSYNGGNGGSSSSASAASSARSNSGPGRSAGYNGVPADRNYYNGGFSNQYGDPVVKYAQAPQKKVFIVPESIAIPGFSNSYQGLPNNPIQAPTYGGGYREGYGSGYGGRTWQGYDSSSGNRGSPTSNGQGVYQVPPPKNWQGGLSALPVGLSKNPVGLQVPLIFPVYQGPPLNWQGATTSAAQKTTKIPTVPNVTVPGTTATTQNGGGTKKCYKKSNGDGGGSSSSTTPSYTATAATTISKDKDNIQSSIGALLQPPQQQIDIRYPQYESGGGGLSV